MSLLASLLGPDRVRLDSDALSRRQVFAQAAELLARADGATREGIVAALERREALGSTAIGQGIALPHARVPNLAAAGAAYLRLAVPIPFLAADGKPVSDVLVLLVPEMVMEIHLRLLSEAASMFADRHFRERLRRQGSIEDVLQTFAQWEAAETP